MEYRNENEDVLSVLTHDQYSLLSLTAEMRETDLSSVERARIFGDFVNLYASITAAERNSLLRLMESSPELFVFALEVISEHRRIADFAAEVASRSGAIDLSTMIKVFAELAEQQIRSEHEHVFPRARRFLTVAQLRSLKQTYEQSKTESALSAIAPV